MPAIAYGLVSIVTFIYAKNSPFNMSQVATKSQWCSGNILAFQA